MIKYYRCYECKKWNNSQEIVELKAVDEKTNEKINQYCCIKCFEKFKKQNNKHKKTISEIIKFKKLGEE